MMASLRSGKETKKLTSKGVAMRRFIVTIGWLASLELLLTACATTTPAPTATVAPQPIQTSPQAGDKAPDFTLADSAGNLVQLSAVVAEHKSTVLVFYLSHT
jgi:hypothetical protein